ncbi:MAG TPA: DUF2905 domain-containing protein [Candidatus Ratteibacteria bacterium]|nr:DUF2905 domain-containing protein [bacterium]HRS05907.1 DUF2905 domain-containing protein [Candidatus Ratteibacteria bacterium]HON06423.1 DUF2905 domain-containing protein [bacterium]HPC29472.1 DUF2905 domain-containing protein [bacterium]HQL65181.1 DUF2905 domain-containing protein [bacterium]
MGRFFIITGIFLVLIGFFFETRIPLGKLPGDISYHHGNFHFYFPLTTCIILSILLTLLIMLFTRK